MELSFETIDAMTRGRLGTFDAPCPECGPGRSTAANQKRKVLRIWREDGNFASFSCARCGSKGYARRDGTTATESLADSVALLKRTLAGLATPVADTGSCYDITASALRLWANAGQADSNHPYLVRKGICAHGDLRQIGGRIVVRMQHPARVTGLQFISANGDKRFLKGSILKASYTILGDPSLSDKIIIAEGYATAASIHAATGHATVVAFAAGNLRPVAETFGRYPLKAKLIFAADDDDVGLRAAEDAARAVGGSVAVASHG